MPVLRQPDFGLLDYIRKNHHRGWEIKVSGKRGLSEVSAAITEKADTEFGYGDDETVSFLTTAYLIDGRVIGATSRYENRNIFSGQVLRRDLNASVLGLDGLVWNYNFSPFSLNGEIFPRSHMVDPAWADVDCFGITAGQRRDLDLKPDFHDFFNLSFVTDVADMFGTFYYLLQRNGAYVADFFVPAPMWAPTLFARGGGHLNFRQRSFKIGESHQPLPFSLHDFKYDGRLHNGRAYVEMASQLGKVGFSFPECLSPEEARELSAAALTQRVLDLPRMLPVEYSIR